LAFFKSTGRILCISILLELISPEFFIKTSKVSEVIILLSFILTAPIERISSFFGFRPVVSVSKTTYSPLLSYSNKNSNSSSLSFERFAFAFKLEIKEKNIMRPYLDESEKS
jgi:hypothetical protein